MHPVGWAAGAGIAIFYCVFSASLQFLFYYRKAASAASWKTQSGSGRSRLGGAAAVPWLPALDALRFAADARAKRQPWHWLLSSVNLALASAAAALTVDAIATGRSRVYLDWPADWSTARCVGTAAGHALFIICLHQLQEYWWHRLMHLPWFYKTFHKLHHAYKSPEPFDDMYINPLEAVGYYIILYSPPFTIRMHWTAFAVYMAVMGTAGVLDHSGIRLCIPGLYTTVDHDRHHQLFNVNYAFPFPWLDWLHGTAWTEPKEIPGENRIVVAAPSRGRFRRGGLRGQSPARRRSTASQSRRAAVGPAGSVSSGR